MGIIAVILTGVVHPLTDPAFCRERLLPSLYKLVEHIEILVNERQREIGRCLGIQAGIT